MPKIHFAPIVAGSQYFLGRLTIAFGYGLSGQIGIKPLDRQSSV